MTLRGRLVLVKRVPAGSGVSYGHIYTTERETTLGLVPLGYADGVPARRRQRRAGARRRAQPDRRRPGLHGPVRARPRRRRRSRSATRWCCSAPATTASRPRRTGPRRPARSPTRSSPGSGPRVPRVYVDAGRDCRVTRRDTRADLGQAGGRRRRGRRSGRGGRRGRAGRRAVRRRAVVPQRHDPEARRAVRRAARRRRAGDAPTTVSRCTSRSTGRCRRPGRRHR